MEFTSKEEMMEYEEQREKYYMEYLNASVFKIYKLLLRDIFICKYRLLKKEYDSYFGGWYRDQVGVIHSARISIIDTSKIKDNEICIDDDGRIYIFNNGQWIQYINKLGVII